MRERGEERKCRRVEAERDNTGCESKVKVNKEKEEEEELNLL